MTRRDAFLACVRAAAHDGDDRALLRLRVERAGRASLPAFFAAVAAGRQAAEVPMLRACRTCQHTHETPRRGAECQWCRRGEPCSESPGWKYAEPRRPEAIPRELGPEEAP